MLSTLILTKSDDPTEIPLIRSSSRFLKVPGLNVVELNYRIHLLCEIDIPVFQEKYILPVPHIRIICSELSVTLVFFTPKVREHALIFVSIVSHLIQQFIHCFVNTFYSLLPFLILCQYNLCILWYYTLFNYSTIGIVHQLNL